MLEVLLLSALAGLATCLGGIIVLLLGKPTEKSLAIFLGLAVGIMVAVVVLDLLPSAWKYSNFYTTAAGLCLGIAVLGLIDLVLSVLRPACTGARNNRYLLNMGYLIAMGIALHDLPEGVAIAAGYEAQQSLGWLIALAIGLHNIPEGMATAAPLRMGGMSQVGIIVVIGLVSIFTPLGTIIGVVLTKISPQLIALLLAMAGGAMIYIVRFELIPESRRRHPNYAHLGAVIGFAIILFLQAIH
jgi:ZIP family zinc transporter